MKYIIAPVHITPVKPLVPSHINHLIFTDVVYKVLKTLYPQTVYLYDKNLVSTSTQVAKLVAYLQAHPHLPLTSDFEVGLAYVKANQNPVIFKNLFASPPPVVQTVLKSWKKQHLFLNLYDPGLTKDKFKPLPTSEVLAILSELGVLLDCRKLKGGTYLDLTSQGLPLKQLTDQSGTSLNFLTDELRLILPISQPGDTVILIYDQGVSLVYSLIKKVLELRGVWVLTFLTNRISIAGKMFSSREGGWENFTLEKIVSRYTSVCTTQQIRLGLKLYFLKSLRGNKNKNFDFLILDKYINKAQKILDGINTSRPTSEDFLQKFKKWPTPYQISDLIFGPKTDPDLKQFIIRNFFI